MIVSSSRACGAVILISYQEPTFGSIAITLIFPQFRSQVLELTCVLTDNTHRAQIEVRIISIDAIPIVIQWRMEKLAGW